MKRNSIILIVFSIMVIFVAYYAGAFGPHTYDECIAKSMNGVQSDVAAKAIINSCNNRFRKAKKESIDITYSCVQNINGNAQVDYGQINGKIYNGCSGYRVTSLLIYIDNDGDIRNYNINIDSKPFTTTSFRESVDWQSINNLKWGIVSMHGYHEE